jgi:L-lactate dehydrogenase complex protein LldG
LQGKFIYCINRQELAFQLSSLIKKQDWNKVYCVEDKLIEPVASQLDDRLVKTDLANCDVSITGCEYLVARTGTVVMTSAQTSGRTTSVYAPVHICIAYTNQLVYDLKDALQAAKDKYGSNLPSLITFATGPSRTADIEKTLVVGVHGPKEVYLFLVEA